MKGFLTIFDYTFLIFSLHFPLFPFFSLQAVAVAKALLDGRVNEKRANNATRSRGVAELGGVADPLRPRVRSPVPFSCRSPGAPHSVGAPNLKPETMKR